MSGRARTAGDRGGLWTERTVAWYQRANARRDYAAKVLGAVRDLLVECRSALDVGAGFGALALPLAERMDRVTAMEPSPAMAAALEDEARRRGLGNLEVVRAAWGDVLVAPHDVVLCAHVGPLLGRGSTFLAQVGTIARRGVVLVRDASGPDDKFFFAELYPRLLGQPYRNRCVDAETLEVLRELGVEPVVTTVSYRSDQPFTGLEEACDFWMTYMGLESEEARAFLRGFLAERLEREGPLLIAPFRKRASVMAWRV